MLLLWLAFFHVPNKNFLDLSGSGHFNRSMRLWALRKKKWSLSDKGLFYEGTNDRVKESNGKIFEPACEKDVFDKIGIRYKQPVERDGFDAVEGIDDGEVLDDDDMSRAALIADEKKHSWVK